LGSSNSIDQQKKEERTKKMKNEGGASESFSFFLSFLPFTVFFSFLSSRGKVEFEVGNKSRPLILFWVSL